AGAAVAYETVFRPLPVFVPLGKPCQELFGISRSTQAELIRKRELRSVLVGEVRGRRMIEVQSMLEYLERQRQREAAGQVGIASPNPYTRKHHVEPVSRESDRIEPTERARRAKRNKVRQTLRRSH